MTQLITTLGPRSANQLGLILPHEHIFVDLGPIEEANYLTASAAEVVAVMAPRIEAIKVQGVTALVECTPEGVGRRADINRAVSEATGLPVVMPTGIYREPWVPDWARDASEEALAEWMVGELMGEIGDSGVQAAWIKVSAGDDGITPVESKIFRAAAKAGVATGAVIGSHTIRGRVVRDQVDLIERAGYSAERFIWIHTQAEPNTELHLEMARRGVWLEFDAIGSERFSDDYFIERVQTLAEAGYEKQLLLSHDRGWYDPSQPGGGLQKPYTILVDRFLPALQAAGTDRAMVEILTVDNPFRAYAR